jgi:peptide subunit release factor 1 (eRF1)
MKLHPDDLKTIRALRGVSDARGILSVYLPIQPGRGVTHGHAPELMDLLKPLDAGASTDVKARIEEESARALEYLRGDFRPSGATLALFSCTPAGIWAALHLQLPSPAVARFEAQPYLAPIDALLEDNPAAVAVLADHKEARFISMRLGELAGSERRTSDVPGRQRQGGWSAFRYERDRVSHIDAFNKRIVEKLTQMERDQPFQYLALGGTDETTHAIAGILPPSLASRLAGTFRAEQFATDAEVVDKAQSLVAAAERAQEQALVQRLIEDALAGGQAALGVEETLQTLRDGRVHALVLAAGVYDSAVGNQALELAAQTGAPVEIARGEAEALLEPYGGFAARLRY